MKKLLLIIIGTFLIFTIFTILTARIFTHVGIDDTFGFPFTYLTKYEGKCDSCSTNRETIDYINLIADIVFAATLSIILYLTFERGKYLTMCKKN